MKTFFQSKTPIYDEKTGKVTGYKSHTYRREKPKQNWREIGKQYDREAHAILTSRGVPRRANGQKLGLRKRKQFIPAPF